MKICPKTSLLMAAAALAAVTASLPAMAQSGLQPDTHDGYSPGDLLNHTTAADGAVSMQWIQDEALQNYGLDWIVMSAPGGYGVRDGRFDDFEFDGSQSGEGAYWDETLHQQFAGVTVRSILGTVLKTADYSPNGSEHQAMWRWQSISQVDYPVNLAAIKYYGRTVLESFEQNVPGHDQAAVGIIGNQFPKHGTGNALDLAKYEYLYDANDLDTTGGAKYGWTGKDTNPADKIGTAGHTLALQGVQYLQQNYPTTSYFLPAHIEQNGPSSPTANTGYNIEDLRDFNNAAPTVAFGVIGPGHAAAYPRGGYGPNSTGGGTFGGKGLFVQIGQGWDAMLGEGRNFWFFGSSDYVSRGTYQATVATTTGTATETVNNWPFDAASTADFNPGEYEKTYVLNAPNLIMTAQRIVDGLASGNSYTSDASLNGDDTDFSACDLTTKKCAVTGGTLVVNPGDKIKFNLNFDHTKTTSVDKSPYVFANPLLAQSPLNMNVPINQALLDHLDFIMGDVTGPIDPTDPNYTNATNPSAHIYKTFNSTQFLPPGPGVDGNTVYFYMTAPSTPFYMRVRGTNMPANVPFVTDAMGNPLPDAGITANVPCTDPKCPKFLPVNASGQKMVAYDVLAWANAWTYVNPIFIRPSTSGQLLAEKAVQRRAVAKLAGQ